ncbi:MAG: alpha/beta hydrolase, partial [Methyloceanibacter sp.]|uniref:alpha/beta hydrolase n=1 Tax=Methyloceanibacter sp. TaxID=1965321 RepID=UPI003D6D1EEE
EGHIRIRKISDRFNEGLGFVCHTPNLGVGAYCVKYISALASPGPRAGILPPTDAEKQLGQDLMSTGPFWTKVLDPVFDLAKIYTLNRLPPDEQRRVFDRFGPESGKALFELFIWMFDQTGATVVDTASVRCPVLCLSGVDDRIVSIESARETAAAYPQAAFWELEDHAHMLLLEPGADAIARRIADWLG